MILDDQIKGGQEVTENSLYLMKRTSPWIKFISILSFIGGGFLVLASLVGLTMLRQFPQLGLLIFFLYLVFGIISITLGLFLFRYGDGLASFSTTRNPNVLENGLLNQLRFWRTYGILAICFIVLYIVFIVLITNSPYLLQTMLGRY